MLDGEKVTHELDLNRNAKVKIKTKKLGDEYYNTIELTASVVTKTPPHFEDKEAVVRMVEDIDLEEEQQSMDLEGGDK